MIDIVFPGKSYNELRNNLLKTRTENCAILLGKWVNYPSNHGKLLVRTIHYPNDTSFIYRDEVSVALKPDFLAPLVKLAKNQNLSLIFVHTHPFSLIVPFFSLIDDKGESILFEFLLRRNLIGPHFAVVLSETGIAARRLASTEAVGIIQVGETINQISGDRAVSIASETYDRQIRAFGKEGQQIIKRLKIGIVGLGGTGSIVLQQLSHLGVEKFVLIDPDFVEETNLNRLAGATASDVGKFKVDVAGRFACDINNSAEIKKICGDILDSSVAKNLFEVDFIFCCTDSHGSRAIINQIVYQYYVPAIDMGVSITSKNGTVTDVAGRVQMLAPSLSCLICTSILDSEEIRRDFLPEEHSMRDQYIIGGTEPQPSVMSLNSTMGSLAITMFLAAVAGVPSKSRFQIYNGVAGTVRSAVGITEPQCVVCSKWGGLGRGDEWPLPSRKK